MNRLIIKKQRPRNVNFFESVITAFESLYTTKTVNTPIQQLLFKYIKFDQFETDLVFKNCNNNAAIQHTL